MLQCSEELWEGSPLCEWLEVSSPCPVPWVWGSRCRTGWGWSQCELGSSHRRAHSTARPLPVECCPGYWIRPSHWWPHLDTAKWTMTTQPWTMPLTACSSRSHNKNRPWTITVTIHILYTCHYAEHYSMLMGIFLFCNSVQRNSSRSSGRVPLLPISQSKHPFYSSALFKPIATLKTNELWESRAVWRSCRLQQTRCCFSHRLLFLSIRKEKWQPHLHRASSHATFSTPRSLRLSNTFKSSPLLDKPKTYLSAYSHY